MGIYDRHARYYDAIRAARGRDAAADVDRLFALAGQHGRAPTSVLDVACGTGLHLAEFARRLDDVVGVDLSPQMLEVAHDRTPEVRLEQGDFRTFELGRAFDLVTCLSSSIGHVADLEELREAVARMAAHVAPGGLLAVETWLTPEQVDLSRTKDAAVAETETDRVAWVSSAWLDDDALVVEFGWLVADDDGCHADIERHRMPLFTEDQYVEAVRDAGLTPTWVSEPAGLSSRPLVLGHS
jgi:SAM-dependent methyltransferase